MAAEFRTAATVSEWVAPKWRERKQAAQNVRPARPQGVRRL